MTKVSTDAGNSQLHEIAPSHDCRGNAGMLQSWVTGHQHHRASCFHFHSFTSPREGSYRGIEIVVDIVCNLQTGRGGGSVNLCWPNLSTPSVDSQCMSCGWFFLAAISDTSQHWCLSCGTLIQGFAKWAVAILTTCLSNTWPGGASSIPGNAKI